MKKVLSWLFILLGTALLAISDSRSLMRKIVDKRNHLSGWLSDRHTSDAGDLVSMAYLDDEKKFYSKKDYRFTKPSDTTCRNIDLYVWGDSYVKDIPDSAWASVGHYHFGRRGYDDLNYKLDPHRKNVLIIETAERFLRPDFLHLFPIFDYVKKDQAAIFGIKAGDLFNHDIDQNLEYNLFNYPFIDPVRQWKARCVYSLFGRASGNVALSDNGKFLFIRESIDPHSPLSSYAPIGKPELAQIMDNLQAVYSHYKNEGFDAVYYAVIPNPVTILQPDRYNGLIPALQQWAAPNGIHFLDIYTPFVRHPDPASLYLPGDSHWNNNGMQLWLRMVNDELRKICKSPT